MTKRREEREKRRRDGWRRSAKEEGGERGMEGVVYHHILRQWNLCAVHVLDFHSLLSDSPALITI